VPRGKVDKVSVVVGWARDDNTWSDYSRLKTARIEVYDSESTPPRMVLEQEVTFEDSKGRQVIDLPDPSVGGEFQGGKVRLVVTGVHPGKDYAHLAMGEILVHMAEFDAQTVNIATPPTSEADGHDASNMIDGSNRTYWASEGPGANVEFAVDGGRYAVSSIGLVQGPKSLSRPRTIEVTQSYNTKRYVMEDRPGAEQRSAEELATQIGRIHIRHAFPGTSSRSSGDQLEAP